MTDKGLFFSVVLFGTMWVSSCATESAEKIFSAELPAGIKATSEDELILSKEFKYDLLVKWKDTISESGYFGYNNNQIAFIPLEENGRDGLLCVNHEYVDPKFVSAFFGDIARMRKQILIELENVGVSIVRVKKKGAKWRIVEDDPYNKKISGSTIIPFAWNGPINNATEVMGTVANAEGTVTPWRTFLSCEKHYDLFYGELAFGKEERIASLFDWEPFFTDNKPQQYGWIVEIDPKTTSAKKLTALGRFKHAGVAIKELPDGRLAVYSGDSQDGYLFKFVSSVPQSLERGILYVADMEEKKWLPLDTALSPTLASKFDGQTEILTYANEAAASLGASKIQGLRDVATGPRGGVYVSAGVNVPDGLYYGAILKFDESVDDESDFEWDTYLEGGEETGFACPSDLVFDRWGNLWFTTDIAPKFIGTGPYESYGNNGLFTYSNSLENAGQVVQVASAPADAELSGLTFTEDGSSLFMSVQHPGERSRSIYDFDFTSHWPEGGNSVPKSAVVVISRK